MIYLFSLLIMAVFAYRFDLDGRTANRNVCYNLLLLTLIGLAGCRYRIGTDSISYEYWFTYTVHELWNFRPEDFSVNRFEPGFVLLATLVKSIFNDWTFFQIVHAIIVNVSVFAFFKRYSKAPFFCVLIYFVWLFYAFHGEIMRQSVAISLWLWSVPYLLNRSYRKYYIMLIGAFFFHRSIVVLGILPFLASLKTTRNLMITLMLLIVLSFPLSRFVNDNYLVIMSLFSSESIIETMSNYVGTTNLSAFNFNVFGLIFFFMSGIGIYVICKIYDLDINDCIPIQNDTYNRTVDFDVLLSLYLIFNVLSLGLPVLYRFSWYLGVVPVLYLGSFFTKKITTSSLIIPLKIVVSIFFLFRIYSDNTMFEGESKIRYYQRYIPYTSIFNEETDTDRESIYIMYNKYRD